VGVSKGGRGDVTERGEEKLQMGTSIELSRACSWSRDTYLPPIERDPLNGKKEKNLSKEKESLAPVGKRCGGKGEESSLLRSDT